TAVDSSGYGGSYVKTAVGRRQQVGAVDEFALTLPIDVAEAPLARELKPFRHQCQMQVRQMRKCKHRGASAAMIGARDRRGATMNHELPIRIPTANTSTPPTTTGNTAGRTGVSW